MSRQQRPPAGRMETARAFDDRKDLAPEKSHRLEEIISSLLRVGVLTAATLLAAGLSWIVFGASTTGAGPTVGEALAGLRSLDPESLAALGVIVLVATPILQLLTSAVLFWREHDRLYVGLTLVVCAIVATGALLTRGVA